MASIALLIILGLVLLVVGAELFVRNATNLAYTIGASPLFVGLTVVALGTSAPEIAVTLTSIEENQANIAVGNVIGSNVANLLLIAGTAALIQPLVVNRHLITFHSPIMLLATIALYLAARTGSIDRWEAATLCISFIAYLLTSLIADRTHFATPKGPDHPSASPLLLSIAGLVAGLTLLLIGASKLVDGAVLFAERAGVNSLLIGLTIVAIGTSLPELATSIIASARGHLQLALGNIVGSNIANILLVLGIGCVSHTEIAIDAQVITWNLPMLVFITIWCTAVFVVSRKVDRRTGFWFVAMYALYIIDSVATALKLPVSFTTHWMLIGSLCVLAVSTMTRVVLLSREPDPSK